MRMLGAGHGHFAGSEGVPVTRAKLAKERYLAAQPGFQREKGFSTGAAYPGVLLGDQVKPQLLDPAVVGTLEVAADGEAVIVRRVTRGFGVVGGHRDARRASHDPVAVGVPPERVFRSDAGHTLAVVLGAGGRAEMRLEQLAEIFGFGKLEPRADGHVADVTVVRVIRPALVRDDGEPIELDLEAPVERDEDRVI